MFGGADGWEVNFVNKFEDICTIIQHYIPKDPKKMSSLEFRRKLIFIKNELRRAKKRNKQSA